jgi:glycosyltransferase involved in cell wall biosynthesis
MQKPTVSVLVPTYNRPALLRETLDSILAQTFADFEVIVSNNHSTDDTEQVILEYETRDARIRGVKPAEPLAPAENWNFALRNSRACHVAYLFDDDLWEPTFLNTVVKVIEQQPQVDLVSTGFVVLYQDGSTLPRRFRTLGTGEVVDPLRTILLENPFNMSFVLFRRDMLEELGGWPASVVADYELCVRAAAAQKRFFYIESPHGRYRSHDANWTRKQIEFSLSVIRFLEGQRFPGLEHERLRKRKMAGAFATAGRVATDLGRAEDALRYFHEGIRLFPWDARLWRGRMLSCMPRGAQGRLVNGWRSLKRMVHA